MSVLGAIPSAGRSTTQTAGTAQTVLEGRCHAELGPPTFACASHIPAALGPALSGHFFAPRLKLIFVDLRLRPQHHRADPAVIRGPRFFVGYIPHFDFLFNKIGKLVWSRNSLFRSFSVDPRPARHVASKLIGAIR